MNLGQFHVLVSQPLLKIRGAYLKLKNPCFIANISPGILEPYREGLLTFLEEQDHLGGGGGHQDQGDPGGCCIPPGGMGHRGGPGQGPGASSGQVADPFEADLSSCCNDEDQDLLYVRPEPVRTRNPLLCQKSSSSSGYETCISSVSDNNSQPQPPPGPPGSSTDPGAVTGSGSSQPLAPPRTKRGLTKVSKSTTNKVNSASSAGKS